MIQAPHSQLPSPAFRIIPQLPLDTDPFEALFECEGNEALAAEQLNITIPELYRRLQSADPDRVQRGIAVRLTVSLNQLISAVEDRLIARINDQDNPLGDKALVEILTRGIPALTELARGAIAPRPGTTQDVPPEIQVIINKLINNITPAPPGPPAASPARHAPVTAGEIWDQIGDGEA